MRCLLPALTLLASSFCAEARLRVVGGTIRDIGTGDIFVASGINFGTRMTPKRDPWRTPPYNASDLALAKGLLPGMNFVRVVLDFYSNGTCATDIYDAGAAASGYINSDWLRYIDSVVQWSAEQGVKVAITFRNNVGTASPHGGGMSTSKEK